MKKMLVVAISSMLLASCASSTREAASSPTAQASRTTTSINAYEISVREMGIADRSLPEDQQRYNSRQAAIVVAERAIRRAVESYVTSEVVTNMGSIQSDIIRERVAGALRGAEITTVEYVDPATCYVTMKLSAHKMQELIDTFSE